MEDPHGFANLTRLVHWRRAMPTINFALGSTTINWDGSNSFGNDVLLGLENQARRNVNGGQQGPVLNGVEGPDLPNLPAPIVAPYLDYIPVIADIVAFEASLFTAQLVVPGVGRLDKHGAKGGPEELSTMPRVAGGSISSMPGA